MSEPTENQVDSLTEIAPYLQPAYWNGLMFDVTKPTDTDHVPRLKRNMRFAATLALVAHLYEKDGTVGPGIPYSPGVTFNPTDHTPGTLVLMERERLTRTGHGELPSVDSVTPIEAPTAPAPINAYSLSRTSSIMEFVRAPRLGTRIHYEDSRKSSVDYDDDLHFGIVIPSDKPRDPRHRLVTIAADRLFRYQRQETSTPRIMFGEYPTMDKSPLLTIGQTTQFTANESRSSGPSEVLSRVNGLSVIAEGTPRRKRPVRLPATLLTRPLPEGVMNHVEQ